MKKRNTVLLLGIFAIFIVIAAQIIIIRGVWRQQDQTIRFRYRDLSRQALQGQSLLGFDTAFYLVNKISAKAVKDLQAVTDTAKQRILKADIYNYFKQVLIKEQDLAPILSSYFEKEMGFRTRFKPRIEIVNLELIGQDTFKIYQNPYFRNRGRFPVSERLDLAGRSSSILVRPYYWVGDYYVLNFDYFIDFSDKRKIILREISASLGMSLFSIILVVIMFLVTYRNLMEEKRLSDLKTDFINNMTHELKTPLATITVAGRTLEMDQIRYDESKVMETAKMIGKQSVHLNQLINLILEISMWERSQFELDRKKISIEEVMNDIVSSFRSGCGNKAGLIEKYNLKGIQADIDVVYFTTMINNLLSNAVKYCDKDPVINIEGYTDDRNVCIKIEDNGIGINRADQKRIFDKFYRASSGNIHKYKGLGLGLYYVKKIANAHGGDVTVSSKPGKGSIFTVTIPY